MEESREFRHVLDRLFDPNGSEYPIIKTILDAVPHGVIITNEDCEVCFANASYFTEKMDRGMAQEEFVGFTMPELTDLPLASDVLSDGKARHGILKRRKNESVYYCDSVPLYVGDKLIGTFGYGEEYTVTVKKLYEQNDALMKRNRRLAGQICSAYRARYTFDDFLGQCENTMEVKRLAERIAGTESDVLIVGESGTGKEVLAQAIHNASRRAGGRFVAVNCATLSKDLISSELFGYTGGAFTGANKEGKSGLFEVADHGTILLDEIGELDGELQAKLLRVLEERRVRRIGSAEETEIDVRVIALTNKDLAQMVKQGAFRADLYYRLNVLSIEIPPLRRRKEDIELLSQRFLHAFAQRLGRELSFAPETSQLMVRYPWPGNVRELRNAVEYVANICGHPVIQPSDLPRWVRDNPIPDEQQAEMTLEEVVARAEAQAIRRMLDTYGRSTQAKKLIAQKLGISLSRLYVRLKQMEEDQAEP